MHHFSKSYSSARKFASGLPSVCVSLESTGLDFRVHPPDGFPAVNIVTYVFLLPISPVLGLILTYHLFPSRFIHHACTFIRRRLDRFLTPADDGDFCNFCNGLLLTDAFNQTLDHHNTFFRTKDYAPGIAWYCAPVALNSWLIQNSCAPLVLLPSQSYLPGESFALIDLAMSMTLVTQEIHLLLLLLITFS